MDVFVYLYEPAEVGLDEIEDALDQALEGLGEVTGTGTGSSGSNIDIEIRHGDIHREKALAIIRTALAPLRLPISTKIVIEREKYDL